MGKRPHPPYTPWTSTWELYVIQQIKISFTIIYKEYCETLQKISEKKKQFVKE